MILHPKTAESGDSRLSTQAVSIWSRIQEAQTSKPALCVTQLDHARLSGQIAQHIDPEIFPALETNVIQAISLHDEGWGELDSKSPVRSFLEVQPAHFLAAWRGS